MRFWWGFKSAPGVKHKVKTRVGGSKDESGDLLLFDTRLAKV